MTSGTVISLLGGQVCILCITHDAAKFSDVSRNRDVFFLFMAKPIHHIIAVNATTSTWLKSSTLLRYNRHKMPNYATLHPLPTLENTKQSSSLPPWRAVVHPMNPKNSSERRDAGQMTHGRTRQTFVHPNLNRRRGPTAATRPIHMVRRRSPDTGATNNSPPAVPRGCRREEHWDPTFAGLRVSPHLLSWRTTNPISLAYTFAGFPVSPPPPALAFSSRRPKAGRLNSHAQMLSAFLARIRSTTSQQVRTTGLITSLLQTKIYRYIIHFGPNKLVRKDLLLCLFPKGLVLIRDKQLFIY